MTTGPDLPPPDRAFTVDEYHCRWPTGAEKTELITGVLLFMGEWDERDVDIARRTYPGRTVRLRFESTVLEVHPSTPVRLPGE